MHNFLNREAGVLPCFAALSIFIGFLLLVIA
jgi:hypothetical protein